ncbi:MAG: hypothetical protein R3B99_36850 [Polyangiales bacterium]
MSLRDARKASSAAASLLGDREPPLRILAMLARQLRRWRCGTPCSVASRTKKPRSWRGPPFKARALRTAAKRFTFVDLTRAFTLLAETDLLLKGSKTPGDVVLERTVLELCRPGAA